MDLGVKMVRLGPYRKVAILELVLCKIAKVCIFLLVIGLDCHLFH